MSNIYNNVRFPSLRVSAAERNTPEHYEAVIDGVIAYGKNVRNSDTLDIEKQYSILAGNIPDEDYKTTLNPYNATDEKYKRFPATMRNYDLMKGVIRRYISEYIKGNHEFIVGANNPEVVFARDAKLSQEVMRLAEQKIVEQIQQDYQQFVQTGEDPANFNPTENLDIEAFIENFNKNYIDEISTQGQHLIDVIDDMTDAMSLYMRGYFQFVAFGKVFTHSEIKGTKLVKRIVDVRNAYPIPNHKPFVKDYDMFAECDKLTYQEIIDEYGEYLDEKQLSFIRDYYGNDISGGREPSALTFSEWEGLFGRSCGKYTDTELKGMRSVSRTFADLNTGIYDVWKINVRGEVKKGILTYQSNGFITTRVVDEDYKLNPEIGDIDIEWVWDKQVYEGVRIGGRTTGIYPIKLRPVAYERDGQLSYNGLTELLPGLGQFSIVSIIYPYQVFGNIISYHREMAIAKNKMSMLMIARSLLGSVPEDTIYKMLATGVLYLDDENDPSLLKAQATRMLDVKSNDYITQLTALIDANEVRAMKAVDMTAQRYGEIANSAGKGVTEEAIARGSMGSVIIEVMFDLMREHDYARDMDYTKLAWIDGLNTSYRDADKKLKYMSLNVNNHLFADYVIKAGISAKEKEKLDMYREFAFNASQNGDSAMAALAIGSDSPSEIRKGIEELDALNKQHEETLKQMDASLAQMQQEFELKKISHKADEDRETAKLQAYLDSEIEMIKASANVMSFDNGLSEQVKMQASANMQQASDNLEREKINLDREKMYLEKDTKNKEVAAKIYDANTKLKVAKENKNVHDTK